MCATQINVRLFLSFSESEIRSLGHSFTGRMASRITLMPRSILSPPPFIHRENGSENNLIAPLNSLSGMPRSIRSLEWGEWFQVKVGTLTRTTSTSLKASTSQKRKAKTYPRHKSNSLSENNIHFLPIFDKVLQSCKNKSLIKVCEYRKLLF